MFSANCAAFFYKVYKFGILYCKILKIVIHLYYNGRGQYMYNLLGIKN